MLSISTFFFIILMIFMLLDFRKAFLVYTFLKILLNQNINIINLPGAPLLTVELACNISFIVYFFIFKHSYYRAQAFPLKKAYGLVFISISISTILSISGFFNAATNSIGIIINDYLFVYILWRILNTEKDVQLLINGFFVIFILLLIYGVFEKFTGMNPINDYLVALNQDAAKVIDWEGVERLGMSRVRSAIIHPIGFGVLVAGFLNFYIFLITRYRNIWHPRKIITFMFLLLSILVIFFTNSRSPIIFLLIGFIPILDIKKKVTYRLLVSFLIIGVIGFTYIESYIANILSLLSPFFDGISVQDVSGSSIEMRVMQFITAFDAVKDDIFFGLGMKSVNTFVYHQYNTLFGLESVWLWLLIERGILGIVSHSVFLIYVAKMGQGNNKHFIYFFTLAWFITTTLTSIPGCGISFFLTIIIILSKVENLRLQANARFLGYEY